MSINKASFFTNGSPINGQNSCVAYDKESEPELNGRGGFGQAMRLIVIKEDGKFNTTMVLVRWLNQYYPQEVDKQFVIENNPELLNYLRKNKIEY